MRKVSIIFIILGVFFIGSCTNAFSDVQKEGKQSSYNVIIQKSQNGKISVSKATGIKAGEEVILSVTADSGYSLKTLTAVNAKNKDLAVAAIETDVSYKFTMSDSDVTVSALFAKKEPIDITNPEDLNSANGNTFYKIEHYQQTLEDTSLYDLVAIQSKRGDAGSNTNAVSQTYIGFEAVDFKQKKIAADGSTIVEIYYNRKTITYTFDPNGGNWDGSTDKVIKSGLFGAEVNKIDPKKIGYSLIWSSTVPELFGPDNVTYTANWIANTNTPYKVKIYYQNVEGGSNYTLHSEETLTGTTDTNTNYTPSSINGFNIQSFNQININGDESTVLNVYYNRKVYTVTFNTRGGPTIQSQQVLHGAKVQLPQAPEKADYSFWNWYTDQNCDYVFDSDSEIKSDYILYAFWLDNSITYKLHENVERLPRGGGTVADGEYVLFGDYPQSLIDDTITVDETKIMKMGNKTVYSGSDGNLYYSFNGYYFKVEPIKWRVISRDENNMVVLLAENILDVCNYGNPIFNESSICSFLNNEFKTFAFTTSAEKHINNTVIKNDIEIESYPEFIEEMNKDLRTGTENKIYLLNLSEFDNLSVFPDWNSKVRLFSQFSNTEISGSPFPEYNHIGWNNVWWLLPTHIYYDEQNNYSSYAFISYYNGHEEVGIEPLDLDNNPWCGVVPALSIYLPPAE